MFAKAHARVITICARTVDELQETKEVILKLSPHTSVHLQQVDVTLEEEVTLLFDNVKSKFGTIDVAVSNAGANSIFESISKSDSTQWWADIVSCPRKLRMIFCRLTTDLVSRRRI